MLPPGGFNVKIPEPLLLCFESFVKKAVTVFEVMLPRRKHGYKQRTQLVTNTVDHKQRLIDCHRGQEVIFAF